MGTFTQLGSSELLALTAAFDLGELRSSRAIAAGTINSNFAIETSRGRFFLRVNEGKSEDDVSWEARLVGALAAAQLPTPPPLRARDGRLYTRLPGSAEKWVSAFGWREGVHLQADEVTAAHAETFGRALAQLHVAALALPRSWRRSSIYDHAHLVVRFEEIERRWKASRDPELAHAVAILREELAAAHAASATRQHATHGIIHGDLFRDNVLWSGASISAILDFEQASGGSLAYDLAVCINDWCWTGAPRIDLASALLAGYQAVRPLADRDREALPIEIRASAARFTITRITDVYLAKVDNPEKDFRAFLARVDAWRGQDLRAVTESV